MHLFAEPASRSSILAAARRGCLFAVVDACGRADVPERARAAGPKGAGSLWEQRPFRDLWALAPYLFRADESIIQWIETDLAPTPWGIYFRTLEPVALAGMAQHLERYVEAVTASGRRVHFRFYDPRVVEPFLQSATDAELATFLGPADAVGVPDFVGRGTAWWKLLGAAVGPVPIAVRLTR